MLLSELSTAVFFFCLVIVVHESLVCPEQLNCLLFFRKILQVPQILWFSSIFVNLNNDCMISRSIFSYRGQPRDSYATITEDSNTHWCSRRKNHALGRENIWTEKDVYIFLVFPIYDIFSFSTALQKLQKSSIFFRRQIKLNLPQSSNSTSFHAPALSACFFLLEYQWAF